MDDKRLQNLLRWGIENSDTTAITAAPENGDDGAAAAAPRKSELTPEILAAIMGGPSEADLMKAAIEIINDPEVTLENKLIAFENFEQLIESLDNANNIANLGLWGALLRQLHNDESPELRKMAAWCVGTAVQNNERTQERLLAEGGVQPLVKLALNEAEPVDVRRKAVYALSSAVRNYQPSMDLCAEELRKKGHAVDQIDASDMAQVDVVITALREKIQPAN